MGKRRRKDKAHDVGDSSPGTVGDSQGTYHDRYDGPTFNPDEEEIPEPSQTQTRQNSRETRHSESDNTSEEEPSQSKRMEYAKRYGDSWPEDRKRRFLREHDISAKEMGWRLTE